MYVTSNTQRTSLSKQVPDASTDNGKFRIAGRRLVSVDVSQVYAYENEITCFDFHAATGLFAVCWEKSIYIYSIARDGIVMTLGKTFGHLSDIRCIGFNTSGTLIITGGNDGRVILWNLDKQKLDRLGNTFPINQIHNGPVFMVQFTGNADEFLSAGADGKVQVYVPSSKQVKVYHHTSPVRSFIQSSTSWHDLNWRLITGSVDGMVSLWDMANVRVLDSIVPESNWQERELLLQLDMSQHAQAIHALLSPSYKSATNTHGNDFDHHAGSILHICQSSSMKYLATCSTDMTCKLWNIASYMKDEEEFVDDVVFGGLKSATSQEEPTRTNIWDSAKLAQQVNNGEMHIGNVELKLGYHAQLITTYKHTQPVICSVFTAQSDMVLTSCMDSSIKIWSVALGNLLFQINTPDPCPQLIVDGDNKLYTSSGPRLLVFQIRAGPERNYMPAANHSVGMETVVDPASRFKNLIRHTSVIPELSVPGPDSQLEVLERFTIPEVHELLTHGSLKSSSLTTLVSDLNIDTDQLHANMAQYKVTPTMVLKSIIHASNMTSTPQVLVDPAVVLAALASKTVVNGHDLCTVDQLYSLVKLNMPVTAFLTKAKLISSAANNSSSSSSSPNSILHSAKVFPLHYHDFEPFGTSSSHNTDAPHDQVIDVDHHPELPIHPHQPHLLHYIPTVSETQERLRTHKPTQARGNLRALYIKPTTHVHRPASPVAPPPPPPSYWTSNGPRQFHHQEQLPITQPPVVQATASPTLPLNPVTRSSSTPTSHRFIDTYDMDYTLIEMHTASYAFKPKLKSLKQPPDVVPDVPTTAGLHVYLGSDTTPSTTAVPHGQLRMNHLYAQDVMLAPDTDLDALKHALNIGKPVHLESKKIRPKFTN